ncbi:MAG: hypothetical protein ABIN36_08455 [Ferruginibacter sp.]
MSEENKETTDDRQPTSDDALLKKEHSVDNENAGKKSSSQEKSTDDRPPTTDNIILENELVANNKNTNADSAYTNATIEAEQRETNNEKQETRNSGTHTSELITQNMEVHHHSHPAHGKKTWSAYFWEFLMLFLAVFCGFLAEYQLEHRIEKEREDQFIVSLVDDLKDDEKNLQVMLDFDQQGVVLLDSLIYLLNDAEQAKQHGSQLYYMARVGPRSQPFTNNGRTYDQLKNSGGFRLIRKTDASNKITGYYQQFSPLRLLEDNYNHEFDNYKRVAAKILDPGILRSQETDKGDILRSTDNPPLRTYDSESLKELAFHVLQMNGSRRSKRLMLGNLKNSAAGLRSFLIKQYDIQ